LNAAVTILDPVHADQQHRLMAQQAAHRAQQVDRRVRFHIADRRSREEAQPGHGLDRIGQRQRLIEIPFDRDHRQVGKGLCQSRAARAQEIAANVDRHIGPRRDRTQ
jgi:hypothetical protein